MSEKFSSETINPKQTNKSSGAPYDFQHFKTLVCFADLGVVFFVTVPSYGDFVSQIYEFNVVAY